ncbi:unnamed protein product [Ilex paraguariensis]|uniref:Uncharacterized protein n=1 Tax=Ilex paraguariensis TaxID=185542 RepID=A0ABC8TFX9_9AQUA
MGRLTASHAMKRDFGGSSPDCELPERFPSELEEAYIKKFFTVYFAGLESSFLSLTGLVATWATFDSEGRFKVLHKLLGEHLTWGGVPAPLREFVWLSHSSKLSGEKLGVSPYIRGLPRIQKDLLFAMPRQRFKDYFVLGDVWHRERKVVVEYRKILGNQGGLNVGLITSRERTRGMSDDRPTAPWASPVPMTVGGGKVETVVLEAVPGEVRGKGVGKLPLKALALLSKIPQTGNAASREISRGLRGQKERNPGPRGLNQSFILSNEDRELAHYNSMIKKAYGLFLRRLTELDGKDGLQGGILAEQEDRQRGKRLELLLQRSW